MFNLPETTLVRRPVPKTAFYRHLDINAKMKAHFVDDIERIVWLAKLAPSTLNIEDGKSVHEIAVFHVMLKRPHSSFVNNLVIAPSECEE